LIRQLLLLRCKTQSNCPIQEELSKVGSYSIKAYNPSDLHLPVEQSLLNIKNAAGKYYCPMFERRKVYDDAGDCPVCGMDLVKAPDLAAAKIAFTCPMHPEMLKIIRFLSYLRYGFSST
jgi:Cu2+-exporting ATPase